MAKRKKVYRGEDRTELLQQIRSEWGNVQVTQRPFKSLSGRELIELRVVSEEQVESELPEPLEAPQPVSAEPPPGQSDFADLLARTQHDVDALGQPEQEDLRSVWKKTQRDLDSLAEQSSGRLAIQHQIVEAAEQAQVRIGQVESHAEEIMRVARSQAEEVLEAARREADRLQLDTRTALESAMAGVLQQTAETRSRAAELAKAASDDAQARLSEAGKEAADLRTRAHQELEEARIEADRMLQDASQKTRAQLKQVSEQSAQMLAEAQLERDEMLESADSESKDMLDRARRERAESQESAAELERQLEERRVNLEERYENLKLELEAEYRNRLEDLEGQRQAILGQAGVQSREIVRATERAAAKSADRARQMTRSFDELADSLRSNAKLLIEDIAATHAQIQDDLAAHELNLPQDDANIEKLELPDWVPEA